MVLIRSFPLSLRSMQYTRTKEGQVLGLMNGLASRNVKQNEPRDSNHLDGIPQASFNRSTSVGATTVSRYANRECRTVGSIDKMYSCQTDDFGCQCIGDELEGL